MRRDLALPVSIFGGAIVIAIGLFLGLRARGPSPSPNATNATNAANASAGDGVVIDRQTAPPPGPVGAPASGGTANPLEKNVPPPPMPLGAMPSAPDDKSAALVSADLEKQKKSFLEKCWKPAIAKTPQPAKATYTFTMSFDGQGVERARGIAALGFGPEARLDVADCMRSDPTMFKVAPPANGLPFTVNAKVSFP